MKNRKNIVIAFLLVASLCLSVGFAALQDTLNVNGTINVSADNANNNAAAEEWNADVYFSNVVKTSKAGNADIDKYSVSIDTSATKDILTVELDAGCLSVKGDSVTFTVTIQNDSEDYAADIAFTAPTVDNSNYFTVTIGDTITTGDDIAASESKEFTITVALAKTPATAISGSTFSIAFTATATEPSGT